MQLLFVLIETVCAVGVQLKSVLSMHLVKRGMWRWATLLRYFVFTSETGFIRLIHVNLIVFKKNLFVVVLLLNTCNVMYMSY